MQWSHMLSILAAQEPWYQWVAQELWFKWLVVLAVVGGCYGLGILLGRALRMAEYGWKIGLIFAVLGVAPVVIWARWPPNLGVDLNGGMILIYQIDENATLTSSSPAGDPDAPGADPFVPRRGRRGAPNPNAGGINVDSLIAQLTRRINPGGTLEIKVRKYGERQIEIIIPETDPEEVASIKRLIEKTGMLEFLILADHQRDQDLIDLAGTASEFEQTFVKRNRGKPGETNVGRWVKVGRELLPINGVQPLKVHVIGRTIRDARTKKPIVVPPDIASRRDDKADLFAKWLKDKDYEEVEVLMVHDEKMRITGKELSSQQTSFDEFGNPSVNFNMTPVGGTLMARLTSANTPDPSTGHGRNLGIVLDEELLSAPTIQSVISDHGRITGKFSQKEVNELVGVLRSGSLEAVLEKEPVSENPIGPELGADTIRKGKWSSIIALLCVLVFMVAYYRFSGIVAVWTLVINLLLMFALMVLFHATFTLAGIAGVVLTMGMAVDSNVLIFERIREELGRGAALRMALRNGFARATTTIIDSNMTTLISAVVLYVIGTDQIRGFAVTLILGILLSMFAAIFCARVVFDIGERKRWITRLTMFRFMGESKINFMGIWRPTTIASLALIGAGFVGVFLRGKEILGIDFTGGTAVHMMLREPMPVDKVREKLNNAFEKEKANQGKTLQFNLVNVPVVGRKAETVFKVDSSLEKVDDLKRVIAEEFIKDPKTNESMLVQNKLSFDPQSLKTVTETRSLNGSPSSKPAETKPDIEAPDTKIEPGKKEPEKAAPAKPDTEETKPDKPDGAARGADRNTLLVLADDSTLFASQDEPLAAEKTAEQPPAEKPGSKEPATEKPAGEKSADEPEPPAKEPDGTPPKTPAGAAGDLPKTGDDPDAQERVATETVLTFEQPIGRDVLRSEIRRIAEGLGITLLESNVLLSTADLQEGSLDVTGTSKRKQWAVKLSADGEQTRKILSALKDQFAQDIHWPSWNKIGTSIAGKMQRVAAFALLASCLGIIAYIWFRFEKLMYGLAAIVAVIHDVLVMLTAIALSHWLYHVLGFAGVEDFKINLIEVAAFLTIIGYSLNDTVVIFDRIREVRGKRPHLNSEIINLSVNQTLSRTILTTTTTLIVTVILYVFGGQGLHGFAFALLVGLISGTYSTVFIASPLLLWMSRYGESAQAKTKAAA